MKHLAVLLLSLTFTSLTFAQSNNLQEGNTCFAKGDYACAISKYKEVIKFSDDRQKKIAGDNLNQAIKCYELKKIADSLFKSFNYRKAKEYYLSLLNENPREENAKVKISEIKEALITLSVSKNAVLFLNSRESEKIYVSTEADSFSVGILPSWCKVQKFDKYLLITCIENLSGAERTGNFKVTAGSKAEIITIRQSTEQVFTLSVSKEDIFFKSGGGKSKPILVNTTAAKFSAALVPSWCSIQIYTDYFIVSCNSNTSSESRSDWFKIIAENTELKINVTQAGNTRSVKSSQAKPTYSKNIKDKYFFMNFGVVANDIGNLETVMASMGGRKIFLRVKFNPKMLGKSDNYSTNFISNELEITNSGKVTNFPSSTGYYYVVNDQIASNRQSATLGTSFGGGKLRFYLGGGYGERLNLWSLNLNSYNNNFISRNIWAKNINQSWKGIETEVGIFLKLGKFNIMGGVSAIFDSNQSNPFIDCHLGFGFSTR